MINLVFIDPGYGGPRLHLGSSRLVLEKFHCDLRAASLLRRGNLSRLYGMMATGFPIVTFFMGHGRTADGQECAVNSVKIVRFGFIALPFVGWFVTV